MNGTINFLSPSVDVSGLGTQILKTGKTTDGVSWTWKFYTETEEKKDYVYLAWSFRWDESKPGGIRGLKGTISSECTHWSSRRNLPIKTYKNVDAVRSGKWFVWKVGTTDGTTYDDNTENRRFSFNASLTPIMAEKDTKLYENFEQNEKTDAVLLVEDKKMHVNKAFLSFHSEFFNTLFNSDFKEKSMEEIPIEDVKYEDFARLLSVVYPKTVHPTDFAAPKLLELADRFMMPAVTNHVEMYLIGSKIEPVKKIALASQYALESLLSNVLMSFDVARDVDKIIGSTEYENFADNVKVKILHHFHSLC